KVGQSTLTLTRVTLKPLVTGLAADLVTLTQLSKTHTLFFYQLHKFFTQRHGTRLFPSHLFLPSLSMGSIMPVLKSVTYVSATFVTYVSGLYTHRGGRNSDLESAKSKTTQGSIPKQIS